MTGYFSPFPLLTADVISHSPRTHGRSNLKLLWTALLMLHNQMKTFITCTVHRLHTYRHMESQKENKGNVHCMSFIAYPPANGERVTSLHAYLNEQPDEYNSKTFQSPDFVHMYKYILHIHVQIYQFYVWLRPWGGDLIVQLLGCVVQNADLVHWRHIQYMNEHTRMHRHATWESHGHQAIKIKISSVSTDKILFNLFLPTSALIFNSLSSSSVPSFTSVLSDAYDLQTVTTLILRMRFGLLKIQQEANKKRLIIESEQHSKMEEGHEQMKK